MPIRPQYKWLYPIDWLQLSAMIRFERAKGRCEECGRPHGREIRHLGDGRWWDEEDRTWRNGRGRPLPRLALIGDGVAVRITKVVLATAHLDHDPTNNRPKNLKALCQRCHMIHGVAILAGMARPRIVDRDIGATKAGFQYSFILGAERLELAVSKRTTCRFEITTPMPLRRAVIRSQVTCPEK